MKIAVEGSMANPRYLLVEPNGKSVAVPMILCINASGELELVYADGEITISYKPKGIN